MKFNPSRIIGSEDYLEPCRSFIREGQGHPLSFCAISYPVLATGIDRTCHRLRLKIDQNGVFVYVQLFVSSTEARCVHRIQLCKNDSLVLQPADLCHRFELTGEPNDRGVVIEERVPIN